MRMATAAEVKRLREKYPSGTRVELVEMDDPQAPPVGTKGTVYGVDDIGSILWIGITAAVLTWHLVLISAGKYLTKLHKFSSKSLVHI